MRKITKTIDNNKKTKTTINMSKYLYGAAVQGIQGFIFQTNELKDIVGASELVENICTKAFKGYVDKDDQIIVKAAGNIKCIFADQERCKKAVLEFPKIVLTMASGITISEAVVEMKGENSDFSKAVDLLEKRLRIQRNKPMKSLTLGLMGIRRSRKTGLPAVAVEKDGDYLDSATECKRKNAKKSYDNSMILLSKKNFGLQNLKNKQICYDIDKITDKNSWIAVIHADGNGLGQIVRKIGKDKDKFKLFSEALDKATEEAAQSAFNCICKRHGINTERNIPFRPIVLSGDDHTMICRGDLALDYTKEYLRQFEEKTNQYLCSLIKVNKVFTQGEVLDRLTACAGIAFIKSSYPFYYGYNLAESLCDRAKKDAKNKPSIKEGTELPQSCLMFHKVQDSFIEDFSKIAARELTPNQNSSFDFGPYYINKKDNRWTIDELEENVDLLDGKYGNAVKSHLRQWMSLMHENEDAAKQKVFRIVSMLPDSQTKLKQLVECVTHCQNEKKRDDKNVYPVYDMLALHSILCQVTKEEGDKKDGNN